MRCTRVGEQQASHHPALQAGYRPLLHDLAAESLHATLVQIMRKAQQPVLATNLVRAESLTALSRNRSETRLILKKREASCARWCFARHPDLLQLCLKEQME